MNVPKASISTAANKHIIFLLNLKNFQSCMSQIGWNVTAINYLEIKKDIIKI